MTGQVRAKNQPGLPRQIDHRRTGINRGFEVEPVFSPVRADRYDAGLVCSRGGELAKVVGTEVRGDQVAVQVLPLAPDSETEPVTWDAREVAVFEPLRHAPVPLDVDRLPEERKVLIESEVKYGSTPRLLKGDWEVVGPASNQYSCIAHSVGVHSQHKWPEGSSTDSAFDRFYQQHGFVPLSQGEIQLTDLSPQEGLEKVVLFALPVDHPYYAEAQRNRGGRPVEGHLCTHAIVQEPDGSWTSKNGPLPLVRILNPYQLGGGSYGEPFRVYVRKRTS